MASSTSSARAWAMGAVVGVVLLGCSTPTTSVDPPAPPPVYPTSYVMRIASPLQAVGSVLIAIAGFAGEPVVLAGGSVRVRFARAGAEWRGLYIGPVAGLELVQVRPAVPGSPPSFTILDASGGVAEGYRQVPVSQLQITLTPVGP